MDHVHAVLSAVMMAMPIIKGLFYKVLSVELRMMFLLEDLCHLSTKRLPRSHFTVNERRAFTGLLQLV